MTLSKKESVTRETSRISGSGQGNVLRSARRGRENEEPRPEGRGGSTTTIGRQGPQKSFSGSEEPEKFFCFPLALQPLTANSSCAHGGQPKSPQPISAGRHLLFWGRVLPGERSNTMKYTELTVTYSLDEKLVSRLNRLTDRWRATGQEITPEDMFSLAMTMGGNWDIGNHMETVERFLERKEKR